MLTSLLTTKLRNLIKHHRTLLIILAILGVTLIAYGQTLQMYFWQDDSALIFKLQHPDQPAGSFGEGIIGSGPYKYLVTPFVLLYPLFGLTPLGYFAIGLLSYLLVVGAFCLFAQELFKNKLVTFFSTAIMAAGYIGSDIMFRISNSWQSNIGLSLALLCFWSMIKFLNSRQIYYYLASVFFFWAAVEFVYIRSHSLILPVAMIELLMISKPISLIKLISLGLRQLPFWIIFYLGYIKDSPSSSALSSIIDKLLHGQVEVLASLLATTGNVFIQDVFQQRYLELIASRQQLIILVLALGLLLVIIRAFKVRKLLSLSGVVLLMVTYLANKYFFAQDLYWYRSKEAILSGAVGMYGLVLILILGLAIWQKSRLLAIGLILGLVIVISQIFGYFIQYPDAIFGTTHRYLNYSLIGYSLIWGVISYLIYKALKTHKKLISSIALLPLFLIITTNLVLGANYQSRIVQERSIPSRNFYTDLKKFVPQIEKGTTFYFDVATDQLSRQQFRDFFSVGSMPESTAIAIYYGVDRYDLNLLTEFSELISKLDKQEINLDKLYSFYFDSSRGLIDTTDRLRRLLMTPADVVTIPIKQLSPNQIELSPVKVLPLTPTLLSIRAQVLPDPGGSSFTSGYQFDNTTRDRLISYLLAKRDYYSQAKATSLSEWKFQEIDYLADNNPQTSWRGHRIWWHDKKHEQITINLGSVRSISKLVWVNWTHTLTPTAYTIATSLDGLNWREVKRVSGGGEKTDGEQVEESFATSPAAFVRMDITATLSNDAPAISELEVIDAIYQDISLELVGQFFKNPFAGVTDQAELVTVLSKIAPLLPITVERLTDQSAVTSQLLVGQLGATIEYEFVLEPGGITFDKVTVAVNAPVNLIVESASIRNMTLDEIRARGLIKRFSEN